MEALRSQAGVRFARPDSSARGTRHSDRRTAPGWQAVPPKWRCRSSRDGTCGSTHGTALEIPRIDQQLPRQAEEREVVAVASEREDATALGAEVLIDRSTRAAIAAFEHRG